MDVKTLITIGSACVAIVSAWYSWQASVAEGISDLKENIRELQERPAGRTDEEIAAIVEKLPDTSLTAANVRSIVEAMNITDPELDVASMERAIDAHVEQLGLSAFSRAKFVKPPNYAPGWTTNPASNDGVEYKNFSYSISEDGFVSLAGLMSGCPSNAEPIFILPDDLSPQSQRFL